MTKEEIYNSFLDDPLLIEKGYITPAKAKSLKFHERTTIKLLEVIKLSINGQVDNESQGVIVNKIGRFLNK
jgi:hypothetical protein